MARRRHQLSGDSSAERELRRDRRGARARDLVVSEPVELVLRGDVVTADTVIRDAFVAVRGEAIAQVGSGAPPRARRVEDHRGALLFPGLLAAQVHAGSHEGPAGLRDATRAAAAGGVTTIVDMPFDEPRPVNDVRSEEHTSELQSRFG